MPSYSLDTNDRAGAIGQTGSGKTFLMRRKLAQIEDQNVIIVDTKGTVQLYGYKVVRDQSKAVKGGKVIYRPRNTTAPSEDFYKLLWQRYGAKSKPALTLYIDEAGHITTAAKIPEPLKLLVQAGREVNLGVWWSAQQPTRVHNTLISQSEYLYIFKLTRASDRKKLQEDIGATVMGALDLNEGEYYAYGHPELEPIANERGEVQATILKVDPQKYQVSKPKKGSK